jgi:hypothetical protein
MILLIRAGVDFGIFLVGFFVRVYGFVTTGFADDCVTVFEVFSPGHSVISFLRA